MKLLWYIEVYIIYNDFNLIYVCDSVYFNTHRMYSYLIYGLLKYTTIFRHYETNPLSYYFSKFYDNSLLYIILRYFNDDI